MNHTIIPLGFAKVFFCVTIHFNIHLPLWWFINTGTENWSSMYFDCIIIIQVLHRPMAYSLIMYFPGGCTINKVTLFQGFITIYENIPGKQKH